MHRVLEIKLQLHDATPAQFNNVVAHSPFSILALLYHSTISSLSLHALCIVVCLQHFGHFVLM